MVKIFSECEKAILVVLLRNGELYLTQISQTLRMTYSHVVKIINIFKKLELVELLETGRKRERVYKLTEKGEKVAQEVVDIKKIEKNIDEIINV